MKTSQPKAKLKPARLIAVLAVILMLGGAGSAFVAWAMAPRGATVEITEGSITGLHESVALTWPKNGEAAIAVGDGTISANSDQPLPMASISKLITVLVILEARPLSPGDQGPSFEFTWEDENAYYEAMASGLSALPVPVRGTLTQYQMLEGILIGSACNYVDYLVYDIWGSNDEFVSAAQSFLQRHSISDITMVEPTGIDYGNTATPAALIQVGRLALANPIIAEIVAKRSIELPGVGFVENTNDLLADPGVVGLKTGTLDGYNLLSAKDIVTTDGSTVRVFAVVMNQTSDDERFSATRSLFDQVTGFTN
ncbi:D-alanyl-D-alanine carboxypeptidase family protein [Microbacterium sp. YY-03]|uniref:D-alanyl-D-alanine carboxypeptidase family protein n=1 Tax=Microbacterium sp. YY-03 TaxID=3421636 RepID=UPI003D1715A3